MFLHKLDIDHLLSGGHCLSLSVIFKIRPSHFNKTLASMITAETTIIFKLYIGQSILTEYSISS